MFSFVICFRDGAMLRQQNSLNRRLTQQDLSIRVSENCLLGITRLSMLSQFGADALSDARQRIDSALRLMLFGLSAEVRNDRITLRPKDFVPAGDQRKHPL
jgi:hypothetical protein